MNDVKELLPDINTFQFIQAYMKNCNMTFDEVLKESAKMFVEGMMELESNLLFEQNYEHKFYTKIIIGEKIYNFCADRIESHLEHNNYLSFYEKEKRKWTINDNFVDLRCTVNGVLIYENRKFVDNIQQVLSDIVGRVSCK